jgi:hypothetical protein
MDGSGTTPSLIWTAFLLGYAVTIVSERGITQRPPSFRQVKAFSVQAMAFAMPSFVSRSGHRISSSGTPYPKTTKNTAIMDHRQISKAAAPRYITMISFSFISLLLFAQFTLVTFKGYQVVVLAEVVFNLIM